MHKRLRQWQVMMLAIPVLLAGSCWANAHVLYHGISHSRRVHNNRTVAGYHRADTHARHRYYRMPAKAGRNGTGREVAAYDSLTPGALQLMHLSPVQFARVGAAPQPSFFVPFHVQMVAPAAVSVTSPEFINRSLVMARYAAVAAAVTRAARPPAGVLPGAPAAAGPAAGKPGHRIPHLTLALEMLASRAYHWARHPLETLEQSGDAAVGARAASELGNEIAEAARRAAGSGGSSSGGWFSPGGLVTAALKFIGTPYRWGGSSPASGFDCSGFVHYVLAKFDVSVPRTSYGQADSLPRIRESQLRPGDLVFFDTLNRPYSHVGIYIGHNRFVSAQTPSTGVQVANLRDPYWAARFDGARRVPGIFHIS